METYNMPNTDIFEEKNAKLKLITVLLCFYFYLLDVLDITQYWPLGEAWSEQGIHEEWLSILKEKAVISTAECQSSFRLTVWFPQKNLLLARCRQYLLLVTIQSLHSLRRQRQQKPVNMKIKSRNSISWLSVIVLIWNS